VDETDTTTAAEHRDVAGGEFLRRALGLAAAQTSDDRARALVRLAATARRSGLFEEALWALDAAWRLRPSDAAERAVYTCAISVHCDRADYETAIKIGEAAMARSRDAGLLEAMERTYRELFVQTDNPLWEEKWLSVQAVLEEFDLGPAAPSQAL
jgi:hypothetical protein